MIAGIIPQSGRTAYASLYRLGNITGEDLSDVINSIGTSKSYATPNQEDARSYLSQLQERGYPLTLRPDRKRDGRPYRLAFLGLDTQINGVQVRIEGDESHNCSSLIRLSEADFALVGFDELLATMQAYLGKNARYATRWGNFNYELTEPTDVRIAGSANLQVYDESAGRSFQDFVGFFLIGNKSRKDWNVKRMMTSGKRVYVKGRYEGIVLGAFPYVNTIPVKSVEDAVKSDEDGLGIEIVQSGKTAKGKGLIVYGEPLFLSESLLVADYGEYRRNPELQRVVRAFHPMGFFDNERMSNFADWYKFLERNLGDNWIDKPEIDTLFLSSAPPKSLRPYTLESRNWAASDDLPAGKALEEAVFVNEVVPRVLRAL